LIWVQDVAGSNPVIPTWRHLNISKYYKFIMSLISQRDREVVIEALDFYLFNKGNDFTEEKRMELNALMNWIKIEYNKNEN
jgi:hypothetical protein